MKRYERARACPGALAAPPEPSCCTVELWEEHMTHLMSTIKERSSPFMDCDASRLYTHGACCVPVTPSGQTMSSPPCHDSAGVGNCVDRLQ